MGNILTQKRHERNGGLLDDLTYRYQMRGTNENALLVRNRLYHVNDQVDSLYNEFDIDDMAVFYSEHDSINFKNNYSYDAEGRLIRDHQERIAQIKWRVDGKVSEIIREENNYGKSNLKFEYNAMGQRIAKHVYDKNNPSLLKSSTYYILDAQGNQISMYEHKVEEQNATYYLKERNIYGSSRLGMIKDTVNMFNPEVLPNYGITGNRNYELSNHLGNVLAVVSDNVYPISSDNSTIDTYRVGLDQVYDYSPFGVQLDGRTIEPDPVIISDTSYIVTEEWLYASDFNVSTSDLSSYNGWFATAGNAALFVDGSSNQRLKIVSANTNSGANRYFDVINGERYVVKFDLDKGALSNVTARVYAIVGSSQTLLTSKTMTVSQTDSLVFDATSNQILVQFVQNGTFYVDNFSLLKKGYEVLQTTTFESPDRANTPSVANWTYNPITTAAYILGQRLYVNGGAITNRIGTVSSQVSFYLHLGSNDNVTVNVTSVLSGMKIRTSHVITTSGVLNYVATELILTPSSSSNSFYIDDWTINSVVEDFSSPTIVMPSFGGWELMSNQNKINVVSNPIPSNPNNKSYVLGACHRTFESLSAGNYEFTLDDISVYSTNAFDNAAVNQVSSIAPAISSNNYTVRIYDGQSNALLISESFNITNSTKTIPFTLNTLANVRIEVSGLMVQDINVFKSIDNLKLRKFTGNTSVYNTNYSNMSLTANALDGWSPDNWATTSATVDQAAGQYRLVAIGSGATAKVQREFTAMPNQEHRFQYNLSLLNGGSTTVRVEQKVNGVYQYLATQQTQSTSGTYELSFVPTEMDIRISVSGTSRYALHNLYLDRDQIDTLVTTYALSRGYRYGFNGMEKDDEAKGKGNSYDFGARMYDSRLGRWLTIDPLAGKYPSLSPYNFVGNMPIIAIDPDGRDIIVLSDKQAAGNAGHQAILIGNNRDGWTYISKDGSPAGRTGAAGKPIFVVQKFDAIEDFRNSPHNFELADDQHHSTSEGILNENLIFKLDEKGNKIQRYDEAFYIGTTQADGSSTDVASIDAASKSASSFYCLTITDCSDVVTAALSVGKNSEGRKLKTGEGGMVGGLVGEIPRVKQAKIEYRNNGVDYDAGIKPDNLKLQSGEKGKKIK